MLLIILPLAFIPSAFSIYVGAPAIGLVVRPLPLIYISIYVIELALSECLPVVPLALIDRAICPTHGPPPMTETPKPFTRISSTVLVIVCLDIGLLRILKATVQGFLGFFLGKVLALLLYERIFQ
jgi:hypothetical protein